jgi:very-short-patch-repair endonuclease
MNPPAKPENYRSIPWKGMTFHSKTELKIAKTLDHMNIIFTANCKFRLGEGDKRLSFEVDFLVYHQGKWGVLEVDGPFHNAQTDQWRDEYFQQQNIFVRRFSSEACFQNPKLVVQSFLAALTEQTL